MLLIATAAIGQQSGPVPQADPSGTITDADLKQLLVGKFLFLRGEYLDNSLSFNQRGELVGNSPQGSYTLSVIQIAALHLTRRKLELRGVRYGLHFLGSQSSQASAGAVNHVRITPRKKWVRITIARMKVVKPPKKKKGANDPSPPQPPDATTTTSPAYAATILKQAIDKVFASSLDTRMTAAMPGFWRRYYHAVPAKASVGSSQPQLLRVSELDRQPRLLNKLEAPSNQYAQNCGIAGLALYHAVVDTNGMPEDIAIVRPIGFGLDENAVAAIRTAHFQPAIRGGRPVPVAVDIVVEFRIYSKRTSVPAPPAGAPSARPLPGPYSVEHQ